LFFHCAKISAQYISIRPDLSIPKNKAATTYKRGQCKFIFMDSISKDTQNNRREKEKITNIYQCCVRQKDTIRTIFSTVRKNETDKTVSTCFFNLKGYETECTGQSSQGIISTIYYLHEYDTLIDLESIIERVSSSKYKIFGNQRTLLDTIGWRGNICSVAHYYDNGKLAYKGECSSANKVFIDGIPYPERIGIWYYYDENGNLENTLTYGKIRIVPHKRK